jgi:hypothetical protein
MTAVEWLAKELLREHPIQTNYDVIQQALEMEKQQIIDAYGVKVNHSIEQGTTVYTRTFGEQYYNEKFKK